MADNRRDRDQRLPGRRRSPNRRLVGQIDPEGARALATATTDLDGDGQDLSTEAGFGDPFDSTDPADVGQLSQPTLRQMAALQADPDDDGVSTAEEVGLSDSFDPTDQTAPVFSAMDSEDVQTATLLGQDLDDDGQDLQDEVGTSDPFNDSSQPPSFTRNERRTQRDLEDLGL